MKVKARVQLSNLLDEIMPGIQNIIPISSRYLENTLFFDFVEKYQSYEKISQMGEKRFVNSYIAFAQKHRCRGSQKKALAIYQAASDSIITRSPDVTTSLALSQCLLMLKQASSSADLIYNARVFHCPFHVWRWRPPSPYPDCRDWRCTEVYQC